MTGPWGEPGRLDGRPVDDAGLPSITFGYAESVAGAYAAELAEGLQVPSDLAHAVVLGVLSAAIGGRVSVYAGPKWVEPSNLYVVPVLPPGSRKSATVAAALRPIHEAERILHDEWREHAPPLQDRYDVAEGQWKAAKKAVVNCKESDLDPKYHELREDLEKARVRMDAARSLLLMEPRLTMDDATPEALIDQMERQRGRMAAISAEAGIFTDLTGRHARVPNLEALLKSHAGDAIRVDRLSRPSIFIEEPALSMLATVQPFALREMTGRPDFAGRGLLARCLFVLPPDNVGMREIDPRPMRPDVELAYAEQVRSLALAAHRWQRDTAMLYLDEGATEIFRTNRKRIEADLLPGGDAGSSPMLREWASKQAGLILRISAALHCAKHGSAAVTDMPPSIGALEMTAAAGMSFALRAHAAAAFGAEERAEVDVARKLLMHLIKRAEKNGGTFALRQETKYFPSGLRKRDEYGQPLQALADAGWIRRVPPAPGGGTELLSLHPQAAYLLSEQDRMAQ